MGDLETVIADSKMESANRAVKLARSMTACRLEKRHQREQQTFQSEEHQQLEAVKKREWDFIEQKLGEGGPGDQPFPTSGGSSHGGITSHHGGKGTKR